MLWQIVCDFDGTIAMEDVTDSLLSRFAAPAWMDIEQEWKSGRIGSRECMLRQVDLIRGELDEIDAHLRRVAIDPAFFSFVDFCAANRVPLQVVSDGLDYSIRQILGRYGLGHLPLIANRLEFLGEGRYRLAFPYAREDCRAASGTCKCAVARAGAADGPGVRRTLLIGDGASDFCMATEADMVFAKDNLLAHCQTKNLPHAAFTNFTEARQLLSDLLFAPAKFPAFNENAALTGVAYNG